MKKRIFNTLLAVAVVVGILPAVMPTAGATGTDTGKAIRLGTSGISGWDSTNGYDYVYMGYWTAPDQYTTSGPIKWRVLDDKTNTGGNGLFLLSDVLFGSGSDGSVTFGYENDRTSTWQNSVAQAWCKDFAGESGAATNVTDAFTATELGAILATTKSDAAFTSSMHYLYPASENILNGDKVFLMSAEEAENGSYGFTNADARIAYYGTSVGEWWLRSLNQDSRTAGGVFASGTVAMDWGYKAYAVRPAFNLNLNSVLFTSAADNSGHNSSFAAPKDYNGSEWKLTLKDGNDFSNGASVDKTAVKVGENLTVTHTALSSFTEAGYTNVTAMLTDSSNNILYYGSINTDTTATNSTVTIPAGLTTGAYTLSVYGEDWNGAKLTDYATGTPFKQTITVLPHSHDMSESCGSTAPVTFAAWDGIQLTQGSYYLDGDIQLTSTVTISGTVNLCLNGKTVSAAGGYFSVANGGTLNLCSCSTGGTIQRTTGGESKPLICARSGATANLYNVTLHGGAVWTGTEDSVLGRGTTNSGGITSSAPLIDAGEQREAGGSITLNGGVVLQNNCCSDAGDGGAVTLGEDGTLVINGATICNNAKTDGNAGAIKAYAGAQITLNSGAIYGNSAYKHGGAIQIFGGDTSNKRNAVLTMNGGTIRNNKAGGVGGAIAVSDYSSFIMTGGTIQSNATTDSENRGGGVGFADANTSMSLSGSASITGNTANGTTNNLYIGTNVCNKVTVGEMTIGAKIGVTMSGGKGVFSTGGAGYTSCFVSDSSDYKVEADGLNLKLVGAPVTTPPTAKEDLVFDDIAQELINAGTSTSGHGHWEYCLDGENYSITVPTGTNARTYTVYCRFIPEDGYGSVDPVQLSVTIAKKPVDEPTVIGEYVYNGDSQTVELNGYDDASMTMGDGDQGFDAGDYAAFIGLRENYTWNTGSDGHVQWSIGQAPITIEWSDLSAAELVYSGTAKTLTATAAGLKGDDTCTVTVERNNDNVNVGFFSYKATELSNTNYKLPENVESPYYAITPKALTVTAPSQSVYVGSQKPDLTQLTATVDGLVDGDTVDVVLSYVTEPDMNRTGEYGITAAVTGASRNYAVTVVDGKLTVASYPYVPSTPSTPPTVSVTVPISGDENTIHVDAKVSGETAVVDHVDLDHLDTVIGDDVQTGTVTIDFSGLETKEPVTTVEIPSDVVKEVAAAVNDPNNDAHSFEVVLSDGTSIEFDAEALREKAAQADGLDITISIEHSDDVKTLTDAQKNTLGNHPAFDINVTSGGEHISDMGGKITVHAPYELKPGEKAAGIVVWYVDDDGNKERCETSYDPVKQRVNWKTDHLSLYMIDYDEELANACPKDETCPMYPYTDLVRNNWYHDGVHYCIENGLMQGIGDNLFDPGGTTTRAMVVTILWRLSGQPVVNYAMSFEDVESGKWYTEAIRWAASEKIVEGYGNGKFGTSDAITREQLATILYRYEQYNGGGFTGVWMIRMDFVDLADVSDWAYEAMCWMNMNEVVTGRPGKVLAPEGTATRAEAAAMLQRYCELPGQNG